MRRFVIYGLVLLTALVFASEARAQRFSVSTNLVEWANLGTINGEFGVAVGQHFSIHANARYNNWTFRKGDPEARFEDPLGENEKQFENRKQAYAVGLRYWPWYIYSGWWFSLQGQYMEYNRGGVFNRTAEEGDAYGGSLGAGYTLMLNKHLNVEFGASVWLGTKDYKVYRCTNCGYVMENTSKFFVLPNDVMVSFVYVF